MGRFLRRVSARQGFILYIVRSYENGQIRRGPRGLGPQSCQHWLSNVEIDMGGIPQGFPANSVTVKTACDCVGLKDGTFKTSSRTATYRKWSKVIIDTTRLATCVKKVENIYNNQFIQNEGCNYWETDEFTVSQAKQILRAICIFPDVICDILAGYSSENMTFVGCCGKVRCRKLGSCHCFTARRVKYYQDLFAGR